MAEIVSSAPGWSIVVSGEWSVGAGLEGRGVIVTGAAQGIGRATAEGVATAGGRVLVVDQNSDALADVLAGPRGSGHASAAVDLTDLSSPRRAGAPRAQRARRPLGHRALRGRPAPPSRPRLDHRGGLGRAARGQPQGVVLPLPRRRARAAGARHRRPHRHRQLAGLVVGRLRRLGRVRGLEGRRRLDDPRARTQPRPGRHLRQLHRAGQHRHPDADAGPRPERARRRSTGTRRSAASAVPTRSRASPSSSLRRTPRSSRARRST